MLHCFTCSQLSALCSFSQVNPSSCSCLILCSCWQVKFAPKESMVHERWVYAQPDMRELVTRLGTLLLKHSTWQPPVQGFSLLAVAARGCPRGGQFGRGHPQMQLLGAPAGPRRGSCLAGSCRSRLCGRGRGSRWQPRLGSLPGFPWQRAMRLAALLDSSWPVSTPTCRGVCRVRGTYAETSTKQSQAVSKCHYFCCLPS